MNSSASSRVLRVNMLSSRVPLSPLQLGGEMLFVVPMKQATGGRSRPMALLLTEMGLPLHVGYKVRPTALLYPATSNEPGM